MELRTKERLGGALIAIIGLGLTIYTWLSVFQTGTFYIKASMLGPAFTVLGLALLIVPGYRTERLQRGEELSTFHGFKLITKRWWVILGVAFLAGVLDLVILKYGLI